MEKERLEAVLHQFLLMYRDPVVYMAIAENNGGFDADEVICIRMVKAKALLCMYKLESAAEAAGELYAQLKQDKHPPELQILNLFTLIRAHQDLGNPHSMKSYSEEANILASTCENDMLKLLVECSLTTFSANTLLDEEERIDRIADQLENAEHPFYRLSVLNWLAFANRKNRKYDLALSFYSAAYELSRQHGLSLSSLEICLGILASCANLKNLEMGEEFYALGNRLIAQLRLPVFEAILNFNYAMLKYSLQDYKAAVHFFQKCLQVLNSSELKLPHQLFDVYTHLSRALNHLDMGEQALHYQLLAEKLLTDVGDTERKVLLGANIGWSLLELGRWDEGLKRLKEAERFYRKQDNLEMQINLSRGLARHYRKRQDWVRACAMLRRADELSSRQINVLQRFRSQMSENTLKHILQDSKAVQAKYESLLNEVSKRQAERFIGNSKAAKRVIDSAVLASMHRDASVLIQGESGTGKEVLARMIHYGSPQKNLPFVSVNCAAISPSLFETEFFGFGAGQLTGITEDRPGYFEQAGEGTLFLDEIAEIPVEFQAKLLWALDTKSFTPVGKDNRIPIHCKIIASTNHDVLELIKTNRFRLDLMHRLNTLEITIPPLHERLEDIPLLVETFARNYARETTRRLPQIRDSFYDRLSSYKFPGNVRELKNIIERIFILYYQPVWNSEILDNVDAFRRNKHLGGSLIEHNIKDLDKERIIEALRKTGGKQKTAAKLLNMSESTLCRKIKRYHIK
jgi:transcriptional regulator with PAS, ATPase and Fis domain